MRRANRILQEARWIAKPYRAPAPTRCREPPGRGRALRSGGGELIRRFALRFEGRKRVHDAGEIISGIVAKRLVEHLERSGFVVMKNRLSSARRSLVVVTRVDAALAPMAPGGTPAGAGRRRGPFYPRPWRRYLQGGSPASVTRSLSRSRRMSSFRGLPQSASAPNPELSRLRLAKPPPSKSGSLARTCGDGKDASLVPHLRWSKVYRRG